MKQVRVAEVAMRDLDVAWSYLVEKVGNADAADYLREQVTEAIGNLAATPGIGHYRVDLAEPPIRFLRVEKFMIVHVDFSDHVQIYRILHESRDLKDILNNDGEG